MLVSTVLFWRTDALSLFMQVQVAFGKIIGTVSMLSMLRSWQVQGLKKFDMEEKSEKGGGKKDGG